jgi:predicted nuclease of restriction endonuclease-like (RecB) superfamily
MSKTPKKSKPGNIAKSPASQTPAQGDFDEVLRLIDAARTRAVAAVNTALIDLYWQIGEHICRRIAADGWGQGTVEQLADYIRERQSNARGFSGPNLWRMRQFYETYRDQPNLSTLSRELPWSHNLAILSRCKWDEEREFYLEALDRDVKKPHEKPSIGVLFCATKDHEVVEFALSRAMSPALVAEYQTRLPDKELLQAKLYEFYQLAELQADASAEGEIRPPPVAQLAAAKKRKPDTKNPPQKGRKK